jgi:hypothetical protein
MSDVDGGACAANAAKIGPDADGRAGGCDNIRLLIGGTPPVHVSVFQGADPPWLLFVVLAVTHLAAYYLPDALPCPTPAEQTLILANPTTEALWSALRSTAQTLFITRVHVLWSASYAVALGRAAPSPHVAV